MKTRALAAEMRAASAAITRADIRELEQYGVWPAEVEIHQMIGLARVKLSRDGALYEPDDAGKWAYITPALVHHPLTPESKNPSVSVRYGNLVDLVAWDPVTPGSWALRADNADWLGCVLPQYLAPPPVAIRRSIINWFKAGCTGLVVLTRDLAAAYRLLMGFPSGLTGEDEIHAAQLRRTLRHPWPLPPILFGPLEEEEASGAAE